ncbi:MAG: response regulator [Eubacteriales bacterium]|nr:response regulator [Eubacteriales bacterium]
MNKVLIVEDELLEQTALCGNVKRIYGEQMDVFAAGDGWKALELCRQEKPEIMLVDINIPGISGLELITKLKEEQYSGKILIITAYDMTGYIREALTLGVVEYLLKPVHRRKLEAAMDKCLAQLEKEREIARGEFVRTEVSSYAEPYLTADIIGGNYPRSTLETAYGWAVDGELGVCVVAAKGCSVDKKLFSPFFSAFEGNIDGTALYFLKEREGRDRQEQRLILQCCLMEVWKKSGKGSLFVSDYCDTYELLKSVCDNCLIKIQEQSREEIDFQRLASHDLPVRDREKQEKKWQQRLREKQAENFVRMFRRKITASGCYWEYASLLCQVFYQMDPSVDQILLLELLRGKKTYAGLECWLAKYYRQQGGQSPIAFAVSYMKKHCSEEISRDSMAEMLGFTDTYFSHLFKKETGKGFAQMLNEIRIEKARECLKNEKADLDEVASACGYYNKKYFLEVFKRVTGVSVTEYQRGKYK